jgi:uncharacterized protein YecE (DUF72 family)
MTVQQRGGYYSGTSGLVLPVKNKSFYPPEFQAGSRLAYYASLFNSIEINSSFYKLPRLVTTSKWTNEVPSGFRFTYKLWQEITHAKSGNLDIEKLQAFMNNINIPDHHKGCLLLQFPASFKYFSVSYLHKVLNGIKECDSANGWRYFVEFRDTSWYRKETFNLLRENNCGLVFHDKTHSETGIGNVLMNCIYLRFHGPEGNYRGSYDDSFLYEYASYINEWLDEGKDVYVYFNNTMGDAIKNLQVLNKYVAQS